MSHDGRIPDFPSAFTPNFSISDIPIIGPMSAKVSRVYDLFVEPCGPSTDVWVTAIWWAAAKAFIQVTKPDLDQIITNRAGRPHGRKRKLRWTGFAHDPWNESSSGPHSKIPINPTTKLWRFFQIEQRIGFYIMVADIGLDFTINWYSMAYTIAGCSNEIPQSWKGSPASPELNPDTGHWHQIFWTFDWHPPGTSGENNRVFPVVAGPHIVGLNITAKRWAGSTKDDPFFVASRVVIWPTGEQVTSFGNANGEGSDTATDSISARHGGLLPGQAYAPEILVTGDDVDLTGSYFTVAPAPIPFPFIGADP